ncbi:hypothetical protein [Dyella sp.]|uniref:hypothetical protein n=1 Tax=Dyella sp. TaxID=1869338 RepID=UPI002ED46A0E
MRRLMIICLTAAMLMTTAAALTGCVVVAPRHGGYWVPGHWAGGVWVGGHYR